MFRTNKPPDPSTPLTGKTKGTARTPDQYAKHKARMAQAQRDKSATGRDIGPLPPVANPDRKAASRETLRGFCETYLAAKFPLAWSIDHLACIAKLETAARKGGRFAFAMPRGNGKSTIAEAAALWAVVYGWRSFLVLIGATETAAEEMLDSLKVELETNALLAADFPEVCYPIRRLDGIANRCNGQTLDGVRTRIEWTQKGVALPTVKGSPAAGAILRVAGITGRVRGMKAATADGRTIRPDLVILDDPQTDESARSPTQNQYRENVLAGAVLGLAGPKRKISCVMPCTVIAPGDMADRMLDRTRHPTWNGERSRLVYDMPERADLWDEYARRRADGMRAGDDGRAATEFYGSNRAEMDRGARVAWAERFNPDELSALQHAMNWKIDNPRAFAAEAQNDPQPDRTAGQIEDLDADAIAAKLTGQPAGVVPPGVTRLTAFIDVGGGVLFYCVTGWGEEFGGSVVEYGTFPRQNRPYFAAADARPSLTNEYPTHDSSARVYAGLKSLVGGPIARPFRTADGGELRVGLCLIDSGWATDAVYQFCRESAFAAILTPSKGYGIRAGTKPMGEWAAKPGERAGWNWRVSPHTASARSKLVVYDANHWKTFTAQRLLTPPGGAGVPVPVRPRAGGGSPVVRRPPDRRVPGRDVRPRPGRPRVAGPPRPPG